MSSDIEAHEAAMQRVVEDEKKEQEVINDKKKKAIKDADDQKKEDINAADEKMRKAIKAAQRANDKAIKAAKKKEENAIKSAEMLAEEERKKSKKKLAAMQRDFERLPLLRQVYHEAPDDVFELIVSKCSDVYDHGRRRVCLKGRMGGLNAFRLANKRLKQVVESCTTQLINRQKEDGPESLPIPIIQRCGRIEEIKCSSRNLRSLEGCPDGLEKLWIDDAAHLSDLSPLASCSLMECLKSNDCFVTDISVVSSLLEVFACQKAPGMPSIKDISPLSSCPRLRNLDLHGNRDLKDLSPLSACTALETLSMIGCSLITSLTPLSSLSNLVTLQCTSLAPLANLSNLKKRAIKDADVKMKEAIKDAVDKKKRTIKAADEKMRKAIEAAQRENDEAIKAPKKEEEDENKAAEMLEEQKQKQATRVKESKLATMQRDFERLPLLRQVYQEAPDDVFELMVSKCSDLNEYGWGRGGLNSFRLACKRLKRVVESCTTVLTNRQADGPDSFPNPIIQRCGRIEDIRCSSRNLRSFEGCPDGLKKLWITYGHNLSDLSPLASCSMMESIRTYCSSIIDISVVSSMPLLEVFACQKAPGMPPINDLSPLSSCPRLKRLDLERYSDFKDLSPLSDCTALEFLNISRCPLITSLATL